VKRLATNDFEKESHLEKSFALGGIRLRKFLIREEELKIPVIFPLSC
jgi:hypothetical protein